ncbi:hypothetical protein [Aeromonas veronii]|uniref:hypothetical protein n=1 Tax=Aeromonas veronii TaxID=654 RepID=UPI00195DA1FD|nr:hypothetical protein [Aeromonas veronii]
MSRAKGRTGGEWPLRVMIRRASKWPQGEWAHWELLYPGFIWPKISRRRDKGVIKGQNGLAGYQGFIKMAVRYDVKVLFLNDFYQK